MSAIVVCKTNLKNKKDLLAAIKEMGVPSSCVKDAGDKVTIEMKGYRGQVRKVEIVIDRSWHSGYGDIGFVKADGETYDCVVDDMDDVGSAARAAQCAKFSDALQQHYATAVAKRTLEAEGYSVQYAKKDGKVRLVATAY